jgi:hypothetical protein
MVTTFVFVDGALELLARILEIFDDVVGMDPQQGGALFVFANRRASRIKVLWFERSA